MSEVSKRKVAGCYLDCIRKDSLIRIWDSEGNEEVIKISWVAGRIDHAKMIEFD
jgi:hypothetical protein